MKDEMAQKERSNIKCYTSAFRYIYIYILYCYNKFIGVMMNIIVCYDQHYKYCKSTSCTKTLN